ncbi:PqqD family protein [Microbacter sp. GSS18]|nr:PqqD family protein [Microbacter sp. GSS18]
MRLAPAAGVAVETLDGTVYAAPLPDGPIFVLEGVAAVIWEAACTVPRAQLAAAIAERTGAEESEVATSVEAFVDDLTARGLLTVE